MAAGAALLSTTGIFVALAHVPPTVSALYRMLFGGVLLVVLVLATRQWRRFGWRELAFALLPALAFAGDLLLWHRSIVYVGPGLATLLTNFQVFLMALVGVALYRERLDWLFLLGMLVALAGLWLLVGAHWSAFDAEHRTGVWLGIASGLSYTVYLLSFRHAMSGRVNLGPAQFLALMSLLCAGVLWMWGWLAGDSFAIPDVQSWSSLLALGLFGQVVAWLLMVSAMAWLPASMVGLLLLLQPALVFVLDVGLFARPTDAKDWCGLALALVGIFLGSMKRTGGGGKAGA